VIESTTQDGVAVLAMRHGKANALDIELCQALCGALDDAVAGGAAAVVLTGAGTVFSAGVDLKRVTAGREGYVAAFLPELRRVFTRLAALELPVVAAVNGQALARGLVDEAVPAAELADRSLAAARRLAALGPAFGLTKRQLRQQFLARVHDLAVLDAEVDAIWKAPATLERIRGFMTALK